MNNTENITFGKLLKKIRLNKTDERGKPQPWTQLLLHKASGVSEGEISQIERGRNPREATRVRLAVALDAKELMPMECL